jgi:hypothetical protein
MANDSDPERPRQPCIIYPTVRRHLVEVAGLLTYHPTPGSSGWIADYTITDGTDNAWATCLSKSAAQIDLFRLDGGGIQRNTRQLGQGISRLEGKDVYIFQAQPDRKLSSFVSWYWGSSSGR